MKHVQRYLLKFFSRTVLVVFLIMVIILNHFLFFPTKTFATANPTIEQQINMWDTTDTVGNSSRGIVLIDTGNYTGQTVTYYFEIVAKVTSGTGTAVLTYNAGTGTTPSGGSTVTISNINTTGYARYRSASFSPTGAQNAYVSSLTGTGTTVQAARIIIDQTDPTSINNTVTQIEVGDNESTTGTSDTPLSNPKFWKYDSSKYDGTVTVYFEATIFSNGTQTTTASLYQSGTSCSSQVTGSAVSSTASNGERQRSADISGNLTSGTTYMLCYKGSSGSIQKKVRDAHIIIQQTSSSGLTKMELQHVYANSLASASSHSYISVNYFNQYDPSQWAGGTFTYYFEATMDTGTGGGTASTQLFNNTDSSAVANSEISTANTSDTLLRSSSLSMPSSAKDMDTQIKDTNGNNNTEGSWLIIDVTGLGVTPTPFPYNGKMTNSNYTLLFGNLNSFAGQNSGSGYKLTDTGGQFAPGLYNGGSYKVKAGFQYISSIIPFQFRISAPVIDFGNLSGAGFVKRTQTVTVSNGSAAGYQITVSQDHNLRINASGQEIPATTCDSGTCTPTTASTWSNTLTYGFGYRCDNVSGTDCDSQFLPGNSDLYKSFIASPSAVVVMSSSNVGSNRQATITYKVNVSNTQAPGLYGNVINYIATPTF